MLEKMLIDAVENCISERIDEEIKRKTNEFYNTLVARKDKYIAEVMSGIRMYHESNPETMCVDYKIMFINKYEVIRGREGEPQTDCAWQNDEHIPTDLASTMLKNRFKE